VSQNSSFIAERAREVAHTGIEHGVYEKVGAAGDKLAPEVSAVAVAGSRVGHWRAWRVGVVRACVPETMSRL